MALAVPLAAHPPQHLRDLRTVGFVQNATIELNDRRQLLLEAV
jgi:hypothetical protein